MLLLAIMIKKRKYRVKLIIYIIKKYILLKYILLKKSYHHKYFYIYYNLITYIYTIHIFEYLNMFFAFNQNQFAVL